MGERKVLNQYIPPDFDPSIIPKFKRNREKLIEVRMMLPFSLRCNTCGEYMYRGKKFNSKTERIQDDDYLGIKKIRFYIKCSVCSAEITFKTDPKNADYECESGASRNFELWRDTQGDMDEESKARQEEELDAMKALENKTMDNKVEMDILDALDEIKAINQRHHTVDTDKVLNAINQKSSSSQVAAPAEEEKLSAEDEAILKAIQLRKNGSSSGSIVPKPDSSVLHHSSSSNNSGRTSLANALHHQIAAKTNMQETSALPKPVILTKKRKVASEAAPIEIATAPQAVLPPKPDNSALGSLLDYGARHYCTTGSNVFLLKSVCCRGFSRPSARSTSR
jgi:hypothetical protein